MLTVSPSLTPAEASILDALLADPGDGAPVPTFALARSLNLSASELLAFATSPAVNAALEAIRQTLAAIDALRFHALRTLAVNTLAAVAASAPNPVERRRAASTLLRATSPAPARRTANSSTERRAAGATSTRQRGTPTPQPAAPSTHAHPSLTASPGTPPQPANDTTPASPRLDPAMWEARAGGDEPGPRGGPPRTSNPPEHRAADAAFGRHHPHELPPPRRSSRAAMLTAHAGAPLRPP